MTRTHEALRPFLDKISAFGARLPLEVGALTLSRGLLQKLMQDDATEEALDIRRILDDSDEIPEDISPVIDGVAGAISLLGAMTVKS
jgi:hypothetical protein